MARSFNLVRKLKVSGQSSVSMDGVTLTLPDEKDVTKVLRRVGSAIRSDIASRFRHGQDSLGEAGHLAPATLTRRQGDKKPPKKPRTDRYARRFPGSGSRGGSEPFYDSGNLAKSVRSSVSAKEGFTRVYLKGNRWRMINAQARRYPNLFVLEPRHAEEVGAEVLRKIEVERDKA